MAEKFPQKKKWKTFGNTEQSNEFQCFYCNDRLNDFNRTVDHIIPKAMGGILSNDNKVFACKRCNQFKADTDPEMFLGMVKFLTKQMDQDHAQKMAYYRALTINLTKLVKGQNEKGKGDNKSSS